MTIAPEIRGFLEEPRFAVLATVNPDGTPHQTVMWYALQGDTILMNTARGRRKDRNLLEVARASICVEDAYRYVTLDGAITLIDDQSRAQADITALAARYHGEERARQMAEEQFSKQERVTLLLTIDHLDAHGF